MRSVAKQPCVSRQSPLNVSLLPLKFNIRNNRCMIAPTVTELQTNTILIYAFFAFEKILGDAALEEGGGWLLHAGDF